MAAPTTSPDFIAVLRKSHLIEKERLEAFLCAHPELSESPKEIAGELTKSGLLTSFQSKHLLAGRYRGLVLGQYRLMEQIGKGGTGVVFLAEHRSLKRRAAIKVLPVGRTTEKETLERFYREARAVAILDHDNIVRAFDINHEGNIHYLVMEYVEGESLQKYVEKNGAMPFPEACRMVIQVAQGLQHAHTCGLIHRDIKPANLLLDRTGIVKILDMGLVLFFEDEDSHLTRDLSKGAVLGTADYLSPEQALDCHNVDVRSDIYSLGATFYALLAGNPPFHDSNVTQKLIDHQIKDPQPLHERRPEVPRPLSDIVHKMMAKKPEDRFQTHADVVAALLPWSKGIPISSRRAADITAIMPVAMVTEFSDRLRKIWQKARRSPKSLAAAAVVLTVLVGILAWRLVL
ncbi:MAG: serine/threonine protein kinase [Planctomycetes bacterium]|nr:serine/threonine protein kinase [Planctomycetota bacterium]